MRMMAPSLSSPVVQAAASTRPQENMAPPRRRPVLVVCYSRGGQTRRLARQIAEHCDADYEEVVEVMRQRGLIGYLRSVLQACLGAAPPIRDSRWSPLDYDTVVIGTPVWAWCMASPMRSYLQRHRGRFRRVACFCTYGRWGPARVPHDVSRLCGRPAAATLALSADDLSGRGYWCSVSGFVRVVRRGRRSVRRE